MAQGLKKAVVFCIIKHNENFLMLERFYPPHQGLLVPIGGKIKANESPHDAICREVKEETGIEIQPNKLQFLGVLTETSPINYNWISYVYAIKVTSPTVISCNEGNLLWVKESELEQVRMPYVDVLVFNKYFCNKKFCYFITYDEHMNVVYCEDALL